MILDGISYWELVAMVAAFVASGLVRGFNGGAGANFITAPVVAYILGAREGVPVIIMLNLISNIQVMPGALSHTDWRRMLPVGIAAMATAPLGAWILLAVDEDTMRRIVAATSIVLALLLLTGWRYRGPRGLPIRIGVGGLGGMITGAVSMGGAAGISVFAVRPRQRSGTAGKFSRVRGFGADRRNYIVCGVRPDHNEFVTACRDPVCAVHAVLLGRHAAVRAGYRHAVPQSDPLGNRNPFAGDRRSLMSR